jgi:hypothetical protein
MRITRDDVAEHLSRVEKIVEKHGARWVGPAGSPAEDAVESTWRAVKRCAFCNRPSVAMDFGILQIDKSRSIAIGGPSEEHVRQLYYGMCSVHRAQRQRDPGGVAVKDRQDDAQGSWLQTRTRG